MQSLVLILINYYIGIWGSTNKTLLQNIQKVQNFAAKVAIGRLREYDYVTPTSKYLQWMTVKDKYTFEKCITMYKVVCRLYPEW